MKKIIPFLLCLLLILPATGCGDKEENISFKAKITHIYNSSITVTTSDDVGFTEASVNTSKLGELSFEMIVGQTVLIEIEPLIMETSPVQVTAVSIELISESFLPGSPRPAKASSGVEGVTMTIEPGSVTSKGLTLLIRDTNEPAHTYGEWYKIERLASGEWEDAPVAIIGDYAFNAIGLLTDENGELTLKIDWEWLYGSLESGVYRIVKSVYANGSEVFLSAEFEIE